MNHQIGRPVTFDDAARILTENQCLALLQSREIGRIAFEFEGKIEIFPVNYGIEGAIILFRTSPGAKLSAVLKTAVAFEVDSWDPGLWRRLERGRQGARRRGHNKFRSGSGAPSRVGTSRRTRGRLALDSDQAIGNHGSAIPRPASWLRASLRMWRSCSLLG